MPGLSPDPASTATTASGWHGQSFFRIALIGVAALTALRLTALFLTPLELYPDEAQYWLWSRRLAFGYFSKPPLVAWLIAGTTALGGDAEPWVRLSAPFLHAGAALALQRAGARLYDERTGLVAAAVYALMPAVQLSSGVIATDAPLLFFLSLALWAYAALARPRSDGGADAAAAAFGVALGLACLAKYAAAYAVAGAVLHALWSPAMRARWTSRRLAYAVGLGLLLIAPNIAWNAGHHFQTLEHTAANADWKGQADGPARRPSLLDRAVDPRGLLGFSSSQAVIFGPVFAVAIVVGLVARARRRPWARLSEADRLLLSFALPPMLVVLAQAAISRANANWAAPAYVPAAMLASAWLLRWGARRSIALGLGLQGAIAAVFLAVVTFPQAASALHLDNSFKVARGWRSATDWVLARASAAKPTAIALDDRFLFNALSYYGRGRAWPAPLRMWVRRSRAHNQAETEAPLTPPLGGKVLMVDMWERYRLEAARDFGRSGPVEAVSIPLDPRRGRRLTAFVGEGFQPRPRDPVTGLPTPP